MNNFELRSDTPLTVRRNFSLKVPAILSPLNALPLVDGEFLELDADQLLKRGDAAGTGSVLCFPVLDERGRYDVQTLQKVTVLYLGQYEAETTVVDNVTAISAGDPLMVVTLADDHPNFPSRRGLKKSTYASGEVVVGYASRVYTGQTKIRFMHFGNFKRLPNLA